MTIEQASITNVSPLLMPTGNLAQVRDATKGANLAVGDLIERDVGGTLCAEIVAGARPSWHVIETSPGLERMAASHLIARRFGIFLPETEEYPIRRGGQMKVLRPMFRGYVFIFVWNVLEHQRRILSCPGVSQILYVNEHPAVISDAEIDIIRFVENKHRPLDLGVEIVGGPKKKRWRRSLKSREERFREERLTDNEIVSVRFYSALCDSVTLDDDWRNHALRRALGVN